MTKLRYMNSTAQTSWNLHLFEKEKGGVGSTGSLISAAHSVIMNGGDVTFVESSVSQHDVYNAYAGHHRVHEVDLTEGDARDRILDAVVTSPVGASIFVNVPGGRFEELDRVHELVDYVLQDGSIEVEVAITWTMGLDAASRSTLDALLTSSPPGRVLLNLPKWHGRDNKESLIADYTQVDDELIARIEGGGGTVFQMPRMDVHLYDLFRTRQIAVDRIKDTPGLSFGNRISLGLWERTVAAALAGIY
jgi:hypothetical protein